MIKHEFVPPNPKEFERKRSISFGVVLEIIFSLAVISSGSSKLIFGAINELCIIIKEYTISLAPAIHISWPVMDLVDEMAGRYFPKI